MKHPRLRSEKKLATYLGYEVDKFVLIFHYNLCYCRVSTGFIYVLGEIQQNAQSGDDLKKSPGSKNRPIELKISG